MASAPPVRPAPPRPRPNGDAASVIASHLVKVTDAVRETHGAGVVMVDGATLRHLRAPHGSDLTVVYELRHKAHAPAPAAHARPGQHPQPVHARPAPRPAAAAQQRHAGSSAASEWMNLGFNCGGAVLAWVGVVGMGALTPVTGGVSGVGAALLYGGAVAATGQCVVSGFRTSNLYSGHEGWNDAMDHSQAYVWTMRGADAIGLVGAGGALKELKVAHTALSAKGFTMAGAMRSQLSRPVRRQLTGALGLVGGKRASATMINRVVRQRLLDGVAGVVGLVASSTGGDIKDVVVWVVGNGDD